MNTGEVIELLEAPGSRQADQIDFLNVLRGVAATLVVLGQLVTASPSRVHC